MLFMEQTNILNDRVLANLLKHDVFESLGNFFHNKISSKLSFSQFLSSQYCLLFKVY